MLGKRLFRAGFVMFGVALFGIAILGIVCIHTASAHEIIKCGGAYF